MDVGWIGLGKLGYPCALTLAKYAGHEVTGYDLTTPELPAYEAGIDMLDPGSVRVADSVEEVVTRSEVVFVAVQTPHLPAYGGEIPAADREPEDFEYAYLVTAVRAVCQAALNEAEYVTIAVVSTVLPGTCNRLLRPLLNPYVRLVYNPAFIAMGTTIPDFRDPEFVLLGCDNPADLDPVRKVYRALHGKRTVETSIDNAELIKVAYNVFISLKIVFANTVMEISERSGTDCDEVFKALSLATDRVISPRYLRGGMGDGGACHPRDLIAMSALARRLGLSYDLLGEMVRAREAQTGFIADLAVRWSEHLSAPIFIFGTAYKPGVPLLQGSPALLLHNLLQKRNVSSTLWDPYIDDEAPEPARGVYVIGCAHPEFADLQFAYGSVVIDPHAITRDQPGVTTIRVGRKG